MFYLLFVKINFMLRRKCFLMLLVQICLFLILNLLWEYKSFFYLYHESINHAYLILNISYNPLHILPNTTLPYPFSIHYITKLVACFFNDLKWPLFIVQTFFAVVNVVATYFCALKITGKERAGFWAASALLWLPATMVACRTFNLDYPLAAVLSLWILCYLYSEGLKRKVYTVWFCIFFMALGMIKYSFVLYAAPCAAVMLYEIRKDKRRLYGLLLFVLGYAVCLFLLLFATNREPLLEYINSNLFNYSVSGEIHPSNSALLKSSSLLFRGFLLELKAKVLTPVVFWLFCISFMAVFSYSKRRKRYMLMFFPCALSLFFILFTTNDARYQYPLLSFFCITASVFWTSRTWLLVPSFLAFFLQGIVMSGGWLFLELNLPVYVCNEKYLFSDLDSCEMSSSDLTARTVAKKKSHKIIEFNPDNNLANLFNLKSAWSDDFFYTIAPHDTNWKEVFSFLSVIPEGSKILVVTANSKREQNKYQYLMNSPNHFAFWTEFQCYLFGKKQVIVSDSIANPDYVLQYELSLERAKRETRTGKDHALSEKLQKKRKLLKIIRSNYYVLRLYK